MVFLIMWIPIHQELSVEDQTLSRQIKYRFQVLLICSHYSAGLHYLGCSSEVIYSGNRFLYSGSVRLSPPKKLYTSVQSPVIKKTSYLEEDTSCSAHSY